MIIPLSKSYVSRYGKPAIDRISTTIFKLKYFAHCMSCNFCHDWCCQHGADVDVENGQRINARASELERYIGVSQDQWFDPTDISEDEEAPGQLWWRTNVRNGACVFLNPQGRGCMLHSFSLNNEMDYHELKPLVCSIFPLTFENGLLVQADEVDDRELVCAGEGLSLYSGVRSELQHYFGLAFVEELDQMQRGVHLG